MAELLKQGFVLRVVGIALLLGVVVMLSHQWVPDTHGLKGETGVEPSYPNPKSLGFLFSSRLIPPHRVLSSAADSFIRECEHWTCQVAIQQSRSHQAYLSLWSLVGDAFKAMSQRSEAPKSMKAIRSGLNAARQISVNTMQSSSSNENQGMTTEPETVVGMQLNYSLMKNSTYFRWGSPVMGVGFESLSFVMPILKTQPLADSFIVFAQLGPAAHLATLKFDTLRNLISSEVSHVLTPHVSATLSTSYSVPGKSLSYYSGVSFRIPF